MIIYDADELKKTNRKNINALGKRAKNMKAIRSRTAKTYTFRENENLKQRREKTLQNAKDRKLAKEYFLTASKASHKADRASKDTQKGRKSDNGLINGDNTNTITLVDNINNLKIIADSVANAATNAEGIMRTILVTHCRVIIIITTHYNIFRLTIFYFCIIYIVCIYGFSIAASGNDNAKNGEPGENTTEDVPSPLIYGRKMTDPTKVKTSKRCRPVRVKPLESPTSNPPSDKEATGKAKCHAFDPTNVQAYEFFIQGAPNPKDLEGVEEDQLLEKQRTIQENKKREMQKEKEILQRG